MNTYQQKIDGIIEEALTEKSFSLEIIQRIKDLKDDAEALSLDNEQLREDFKVRSDQLQEVMKARTDLEVKLEEAGVLLASWNEREEKIQKRELKQDLLGLEANMERQSRQEIKDLVSMMFRNPTIVRSTLRHEVIPPNNPNGYATTMPVTNTETETTQ